MRTIAIICLRQEDFDDFKRDNESTDKKYIRVYKDDHLRARMFHDIIKLYGWDKIKGIQKIIDTIVNTRLYKS